MDTLLQEIFVIARRHASKPQAIGAEPGASVVAAGLDSLRLVAFILELEERFGVQFSSEQMSPDTFGSLEAAAAAVAAQRTAR